jgi:hypothetical protein
MEIKDFKDIHRGEPVAILGNGPSLLDLLPRLPKGMKTIGMNASWNHWPSEYWVGLDLSTMFQARRDEYKPDFVFVPDMDGYEYEHAECIPVKCNFMKRWYWADRLDQEAAPCRSTMWFALQLASYMGFDPIFVLGFDLAGPRPAGHVHAGEPMEQKSTEHQLQLMGFLRCLMNRGDVKARIYNCSTESLCTSLPYWAPMTQDDWSPVETRAIKWKSLEEDRRDFALRDKGWWRRILARFVHVA